MKQLLKRIAGFILPDYQLNRVYCLDLAANRGGVRSSLPTDAAIAAIDSADAVARSRCQRMREHAWYAGAHAMGYGLWEAGELVCMTWFWTAHHANLPGRFRDLTADEAVMVDLLTTPGCRGKGYASAVAQYAATDLAGKGYRKLWTWVWRNNWPSIAVFTKAGWTYAYFLFEFRIVGTQRCVRIRLPPARSGSH